MLGRPKYNNHTKNEVCEMHGAYHAFKRSKALRAGLQVTNLITGGANVPPLTTEGSMQHIDDKFLGACLPARLAFLGRDKSAKNSIW
jgi:hypothetical protein